jgi:hypothetical protein
MSSPIYVMQVVSQNPSTNGKLLIHSLTAVKQWITVANLGALDA